ncbi:hypothetical protein WL93_26630 [Burkholderia diffusa]|nr:hypothetical protein WL93_26630 [Burkholderia diffusa]
MYGQRTLLEFSSVPAFLSVVDGNGVSVPYESEGRFVRLSRKLDDFTVRANLNLMVFHLVKSAPAVEAAPAPNTVASGPVRLQAAQPADVDVAAVVKTASQQLDEVRKAIEHGARDANELQALNAKLDGIEAQLVAASSAVLLVYFDSYKTDFQPSPELTRVLVSAAKSADQVNLRGRTDSAVAGSMDGKIAKARALSARRFLVAHGVEPSKIKVTSLAAGDAIAPRSSAEGKAINRRVEIEIVNSRIANLVKQNHELAQGDTHVGTN